jgi:hypothetical protein
VSPFAKLLVLLSPIEADHTAAIYKLAPIHVVDGGWLGEAEEQFRNLRTPVSDLLHRRLRPVVAPLVPDEETYDGTFDDVEYLVGLAVIFTTDNWGPTGRFTWRRRYAERGARDGIVASQGPALVDAGMFGGSAERLATTHEAYEALLGT